MKPGPRPKPEHLKLVDSNTGHKRKRSTPPAPAPSLPPVPVWLDKIGKTEWRRVAPQLAKLGLMSDLYRVALAGYCETYSRYRHAVKVVQEKGFSEEMVKLDKWGNHVSTYIQQRPEVAIAKQALDQIRQFCAEFGMTPSAMGQMKMPEKGDGKSDFARWLEDETPGTD